VSYSIREALAAFRRAPLLTILSVVAIGFSLFVIGLFGLTAHNIRRAIETIEERVEVVAYLRDGVTEEQVRQAEQEIRALPEVLGLRYVSKVEALATAVNELEEFRGVYTDLEVNPLPASLEVRLRPGSRSPDAVERVAQRLAAYGFVEDVRFGREWIEKIMFLRQVAGGAAAIIGGAFAAVAAIIMATAVRIAVFARREEISIMRLVGATNGFIQRPFLLEGLATGLLGGGIAVILTYAAFYFVNATLIRVDWLPASWAVLGVVVGAGFGLLASGVSVRRHLGAI
jgi:cell division transport system permease protein